MAARNLGGEFLVRVEDTDTERSKDEYIEVIYEGLRWLGLNWDNEPLRQSEQLQNHHDTVQTLLDTGHAYYSNPLTDEQRTALGKSYDPADRDANLGAGEGRAVRFKVQPGSDVEWVDLIRGEISFEREHIEDFVIQRADGSPTFFIANVCDDKTMGVTHVIRGEDLINVTPKYLLLREALGHTSRVTFGHLPLIVNEARKKLSKRRDDVSLLEYRDRGYLPEAMVNYLSLLGWGPSDGVEVNLDPLSSETGFVREFKIDDVSPSPAFFDVKKLRHVNAEHLRALDAEELLERTLPFIDQANWADRYHSDPRNRDRMLMILPEVQTRVETLAEIPDYVDFMFLEDPVVDEKSWSKAMGDTAATWLQESIAAFQATPWTAESLQQAFLDLADRLEANRRKLQAPIRVAVTGRSVGPPLFESMAALGEEICVQRMTAALEQLTNS